MSPRRYCLHLTSIFIPIQFVRWIAQVFGQKCTVDLALLWARIPLARRTHRRDKKPTLLILPWRLWSPLTHANFGISDGKYPLRSPSYFRPTEFLTVVPGSVGMMHTSLNGSCSAWWESSPEVGTSRMSIYCSRNRTLQPSIDQVLTVELIIPSFLPWPAGSGCARPLCRSALWLGPERLLLSDFRKSDVARFLTPTPLNTNLPRNILQFPGLLHGHTRGGMNRSSRMSSPPTASLARWAIALPAG